MERTGKLGYKTYADVFDKPRKYVRSFLVIFPMGEDRDNIIHS